MDQTGCARVGCSCVSALCIVFYFSVSPFIPFDVHVLTPLGEGLQRRNVWKFFTAERTFFCVSLDTQRRLTT